MFELPRVVRFTSSGTRSEQGDLPPSLASRRQRSSCICAVVPAARAVALEIVLTPPLRDDKRERDFKVDRTRRQSYPRGDVS